MNTRTLWLLIVATVVALLAAFALNRSRQPANAESEHVAVLLPGLRDHLNEVARIEIIGAGKAPKVTLARTDGGWKIEQKAGYAADIAKLREFLLKLADANVIEEKTSNPARYAEIGVEDLDAPDAKGSLVVLGGPGAPTQLIIGQFNGGGGGGTFARRPGEAQSLLASGNLLPDKEPAAWLRHELIDIEAERIKQIAITAPDGKLLRVYKEQSSDVNFKIADVPKGREPASDYVANNLGAGLANLRIDDVFAAKDLPAPDKTFAVRYLAFDGLAIDVRAWDAGGKNALQLAASSDAAQLAAHIAAEQARAKTAYESVVMSAKLKATEAKADAAAIAKAEADVPKPTSLADPDKDRGVREAAAAKAVDELNKAFAGWTFIVPAYEFANFNRTLEELLKPLPGKTPALVGAPATGEIKGVRLPPRPGSPASSPSVPVRSAH